MLVSVYCLWWTWWHVVLTITGPIAFCMTGSTVSFVPSTDNTFVRKTDFCRSLDLATVNNLVVGAFKSVTTTRIDDEASSIAVRECRRSVMEYRRAGIRTKQVRRRGWTTGTTIEWMDHRR